MALAARTGGIVVNADSQQLFADVPTLTARPTSADEAMVPHRLYGVLPAIEQPSVGRWLGLIEPFLVEARADRRTLVVTGGTGLYLHALLYGVAEMPAIPASVRQPLGQWAAALPSDAIHARLASVDPVMAARLEPGDRQRCLRALEIVEATGRSLAAWQAEPRRRLTIPALVLGVALVPPASVVAPRVAQRLDAMLVAGAMDEVTALLARVPEALELPIAKVHGLRELAAVRAGRLELDEAKALITAQVRQYAKRQRTWFRHQLPELEAVEATGDAGELQEAMALRLASRLGMGSPSDTP